MAPSSPSAAPLNSIQILRAIAALAVMSVHVRNEAATRLGAHNPLPDFLVGAAGVDLFFVISGFIMVYASEPLFGRAGAPVHFFARRAVRIVPLYWAATAAAAACFVVLKYTGSIKMLSWQAAAASLLFFPLERPDGMMLPIHILGWTLNYEMLFYAVFAGALLLSRRIAVFSVTILFLFMVLCALFFGPLPQPFAFWCDSIILEFCLGMMIALVYREGLRLPRWVSIGLILAGFMALAASGAIADGMPRLVYWGLPAAVIIAGTALIRAPRKPAAFARAFVFLGDASYSIYLVHWLTILVMASLAAYLRIEIVRWPWSYVAAHAIPALGASIAVYLLFERPVTRMLQRRLREARQDETSRLSSQFSS
jgi:peptidoglycan/LPS O-acetylase OafA/YrhL